MSYSSEVLADSPYAYWKLDETSGTVAADSSGNSRDGAYVGGVTLNAETTDIGHAVALDGTSGYIFLASVVGRNWFFANWTAECWIKMSALPSTDTAHPLMTPIFSGSGDGLSPTMGFDMDASGAGHTTKLQGGFYSFGWYLATDATNLTLNGWHHCVTTWDGTTLVLYVDGAQVSTSVPGTSQTTPLTDSEYYLGRRWDVPYSDVYFGGKMQAVAIYPTALSAARVATHHAAGFTLTDTAAFSDTISHYIPGGPVVAPDLDDVMGRTRIDVTVYLDGNPHVGLDIVDGVTQIIASFNHASFPVLDPVDGSTQVEMSLRATLLAALDPIDGSTLVIFTNGSFIGTPPDLPPIPGGLDGLIIYQIIPVAIQLTGSMLVLPPLEVL